MSALDELDFVAGLERHDGLLVVGPDAGAALTALFVFAAVILRVHAPHRDLEGLLDGLGDLMLVRVTVDLEGVLAKLGRKLVRLLREADEFEDLVGLH